MSNIFETSPICPDWVIQINTEASFEILKMLNLELLSSDTFLCFYNRKNKMQGDQRNLSRDPEESKTPVVHAGMALLIILCPLSGIYLRVTAVINADDR